MPTTETIRIAREVRENLAGSALTARQAKLYIELDGEAYLPHA